MLKLNHHIRFASCVLFLLALSSCDSSNVLNISFVSPPVTPPSPPPAPSPISQPSSNPSFDLNSGSTTKVSGNYALQGAIGTAVDVPVKSQGSYKLYGGIEGGAFK